MPQPLRTRNWPLLVVRSVALLLAAVNSASGIMAESMSEDGINYLDQGDAWMRGDWATAVNGTWSPLYPVILGAALRLMRPSVSLEIPVVQLVNFGIFVATLVCFEFFWRRATERYYAAVAGEDPEPARLPPTAFLLIGYGLFIWTTICLIRLFAVTPDMLVAAAVFLAAGLLLRIAGGDRRGRTFAWLGTVLGVGYLAKAVMFPLSLVVLAIAGIVTFRRRHSLVPLAPALGMLLAVAGPFLFALSSKVGRFTFSEVGGVSYLKHVLNAPYPHYQPGSGNERGEPVHPIASSNTSPPVFRFDGPIRTTYPLAYDQGYWYAGVHPQFRPKLQFQAIALNLQRYFELFFRVQGIMLGIVLLLMLAGKRQRPFTSGGWELTLLGLAAFGLYGLVYAEGRYLAPFVVLIWTGPLLSLRMRNDGVAPQWLRAAGSALVLAILVNVGAFHLDGFNALVHLAPVARRGPVSGTPSVSASPSEVANGLKVSGLSEGDPIGVIGEGLAATWARLARLRVVADVEARRAPEFWNGTQEDQRAVLNAFAAASVRAVIAEPPPDGVVAEGWQRVGETPYLVRFTFAQAVSPAIREPIR